MTASVRQQMACGFEPAIAEAQPWTPSAWIDRGIEPSVCPGYSTGLPAVGEVLELYPQWEQHTLTDYLGGPASRGTLDCLAVLRAGIKEHESDRLSRAGKKGGGS